MTIICASADIFLHFILMKKAEKYDLDHTFVVENKFK